MVYVYLPEGTMGAINPKCCSSGLSPAHLNTAGTANTALNLHLTGFHPHIGNLCSPWGSWGSWTSKFYVLTWSSKKISMFIPNVTARRARSHLIAKPDLTVSESTGIVTSVADLAAHWSTHIIWECTCNCKLIIVQIRLMYEAPLRTWSTKHLCVQLNFCQSDQNSALEETEANSSNNIAELYPNKRSNHRVLECLFYQ